MRVGLFFFKFTWYHNQIMSILLQTNNLSKSYGRQEIFTDFNFSIHEKQKIGVIGRNGAGKSTLFRIITGEEQSDSGSVIISTETKLGKINQENDWLDGENSLDYLMRMSGQAVWTAKKLAARFEIGEEKLALCAEQLSGGWRMRLKIVAMLLTQPNLFLLDEPTNYLDLNTLLLLENYLKTYKGSFVIISHDREFIKKTCEETLEIYEGGYYHYPGPLEEYLAFKEQKQSTLIKQNQGLARQQEHLQSFVDRFRASASKAKQAQAMIRKIDKLEAKRITIEHEAGITRIVLPPVPKRKNLALRVKNLSIGYDDKVLVPNINFEMTFGERLLVLGQNGQGKTTLLKTLAGHLDGLGGSFHWYSAATLAYHAQDSLEILDRNEQVGVYLRRLAAPEIKTEAVLKMAGDFLFDEEAQKKPVSVLSGGEKSRLQLAGILLSKPDILIMDEPTSHLDFETVEALGQALAKFTGAIIFTSHDRTFANLIATGLVQIENGEARRRFQDYEDYIEELENKINNQSNEPVEKSSDNSKQQVYLDKKLAAKELASIEKKLAKLRKQREEIVEYFANNPTNYSAEKMMILSDLDRSIVEAENEWLMKAN